jgi:(E)-4-hydroxy-3-methylbut-2-enyl-diphosphate synthase
VEIISCPTCGRCRTDLPALLADVRKRLSDITVPLKIAVMGCEVNGPGEASAADVGIAGNGKTGTLFARGGKIADYPYGELAEKLEELAREMAAERLSRGPASEDRF